MRKTFLLTSHAGIRRRAVLAASFLLMMSAFSFGTEQITAYGREEENSQTWEPRSRQQAEWNDRVMRLREHEAVKKAQEEAVLREVESGNGYLIKNFEAVMQMPELPTGCEVTALTMALNYYGFKVDKVTMAAEYLPIAMPDFYYKDDEELYGPDLNEYFIGDPASNGYVCGTGAIITAADNYLKDQGSSLRAVNMTGTPAEELYAMVDSDIPVIVWVTIGMTERQGTEGWMTEDGGYVSWSSNDHGAVLIGYTDDAVIIADPLEGKTVYGRLDFEEVYQSRGEQCVILQDKQ